MVKLFVRESEDPGMIVWLDQQVGRPNWKYNIDWSSLNGTEKSGRWQVEVDGRRLRGKKRTEFVLRWC